MCCCGGRCCWDSCCWLPSPGTAGPTPCILIPHLMWMLSFTGTDNLQIHVTPTSESFPLGKLLPISPTWPFLEVKSSSAADRFKNVLGQPPDNTTLLKLSQTPLPKAHRRTRAHVDFSSSPYQGSGHSASLDLAKDPTETLVQTRPEGGREAADMSGLPRTSMLPPLPTAPSATSSAVSPSQPLVGMPFLSKHPLRSDSSLLLPPPSSSSLAPDSPHSIPTPKPVQHPTKVPLFPQMTPADFSSGQSPVNVLNPFFHKTNLFPSRDAQTLIGTPRLDFSTSSTKQYSEPSLSESPRPAASPTPGVLSSIAEQDHLSLPSLAPGGLPGVTSSRSMWEEALSPVSTQPFRTSGPVRGRGAESLPIYLRTLAASYGAWAPRFQTAESVMTSRELAPVPPTNSFANWPHLSEVPESSRKPTLSPENKPSSLVPPPQPLTTLSQGQMVHPEAAPGSPLKGTGTPLSLLTVRQPNKDHASPAPVPEAPLSREGAHDEYLPDAATQLLSSKLPNPPPTIWTFPQQKEDRAAAIFWTNEKANGTTSLWALPTKEAPSRRAVTGSTSDFNTGRLSPLIMTALRTDLSPPGSPPSSALTTQAASPRSSGTKLESLAAVTSQSELPASASKQVTELPSSTDVHGLPTMGGTRKPAATDVFWSFLSAETASLATQSGISGSQQQTNHDVNTHTINSTHRELRPASVALPGGTTSAANALQSRNFKEIAGQLVAADSFNFQDPVLSPRTSQPLQPSEEAVVESHTDFPPTGKHARDFDTEMVHYYSSTSQNPMSQLPIRPAHPFWPTWPSLASAASLHQMLSDGTDAGSHISSDIYLSPGENGSPQFQSVLEYHSSTASPSVPTGAFSRTPSKVLRTSRRPKKWTGAATHTVETSVSSKGELSATAAATATTTLFLRRSSPAPLSAALTAKGTGSSSSNLAKSSLTTALAKNVTNKAASGPKVTAGTIHTAFPFTPTYMLARTAHSLSTHTAMQGATGSVSGLLSTTHLPKKPQAMHTGLPNPTRPDTPRASTPRPLTITAALTSMTASVKATRLPSLQTGNTDAAFPAVSTAMATTGRMASNLDCQMSHKFLVKTVFFLTQRRIQSSESLKLGVTKGLTQALRKAFHQNDVSAHVDILEYSHNVTVGYYATKGRLVYLPAVVMDVLGVYGVSNVTADLKQHTPNLQSVAVLASPWKPQPAGAFQLKTVLQFVSQSDNIQSCRFAQTMEQRLQKAFQDAERKVLSTRSNLTVQIVSTSNASQAVTLVYAVGNQSSFLNGTVASSLLSQLSAELVGFYLTYPPLTIAEPLEYPNLDTSETTRDYWVITVLQGVDNSLVGLHNQSFARVMEQRLAQLFMMSQQQGRRFKRATTLGSYTVQMVKMQRVPGPKDPAELTYYTLYNGKPLLGTAAAKILSTIDSQRMALTLHHVVLLQADPVVKNPPNNLWIIAAVLAPIAVVTIIIIIITAVLCRKNKNDFKPDTMINLPQRAKPVQGFDYAKQHLGQQGADEEVIPVTQETVVLPIPVRDTPQERDTAQDGSAIKTAKSTETRRSRSPSENGSVISNESGKPSSGRRSPQNGMTQQKVTKEESRKRNVTASDEEEGAGLFDSAGKAAADPFDTSSGSVQLIAIKPSALPVVHPASDRGQESSAALNGEVNKALKQKSDIEHYRNKLRLKAKRKGYYDFPPVEAGKGLAERKMYEKAPKEVEHVLDADPELCAPFAESKNRQQMKNSVYRSRQSLNSPSPGETEMDLLVTRERPRRGIRNSGYDTEPEIIEETNVDRVHEPRGYGRARQAKGHSETSTLSSQPSIDEVRQQMHMLLEEAFSLASAGHAGQSRHQETYGSTQHLPYSEVVTSAPGTMTRPRAGVQWVPTYRPEMYQYSLPRPAYRFSQLPEMVMGSPPPPVPPRTGPVAVASLRRSTSDIGSKTRMAESTGPEPTQLHDSASFAQVSRGPVSVTQLDQSALNYSGNTVPAVFAIPAANRPGFTGYFIPTPPSSYRSQAWMSYAGENELPSQWADSVPLPGYIEAYPRSRYQQSSPSRLPRQYSQPANLHPSLEQAPVPSAAASQQSLTENEPPDTPLTNISTAALVKAIREEVAKLAKKQTDMFEFQV
uniref:RIKEN cDNA D430041D05 gene n=1 Tax=Mus musculus TaxID=10090 RepID=A0A2R8VKG2_MOUSE